MKGTGAGLVTAFSGSSTTVADCAKLTRRDGLNVYLTSHQVNLTVDGNTYQAAGGLKRSAHSSKSGLNTDNMQMVVFDSDLITASDIAKGLWTGAEVEFFQVDYTDTSLGAHKLDYGYIGEITQNRSTFEAEFVSLFRQLNNTIGYKLDRHCRHTLGDSSCGIELSPSEWQASTAYAVGDAVSPTTYDGRRYVCTTAGTSNDTEGEPTWDTTIGNTTTETDGVVWTCYDAYTKQITVTTGADKQEFIDTSRTEANGWFRFGKVTWLTGNNAGASQDVKSSTNAGVFTLKGPMPFAIDVGDTATVTVGCNHLARLPSDEWGTDYTGDCAAKFNQEDNGNVKNFGGFPDLPTGDDAVRVVK